MAALRLVQKNLCDAALFDPSGEHAGSSPIIHPSCRLCMSATTRLPQAEAAAALDADVDLDCKGAAVPS